MWNNKIGGNMIKKCINGIKNSIYKNIFQMI